MPQDYNKSFTNLPEERLKNIRKDAIEKRNFLESIRPELPDSADKKIKAIPFIGSAISSVVRGVTKGLQRPIDEGIEQNNKVKDQAWNETFKQQEIKSQKEDSGFIRRVLGIKEDPNLYGKTALGNLPKPTRVRDAPVTREVGKK